MHTQLAVLGGGPGGYAAAFGAADAGMQVTLIESDERLGGTCLLRGCIPSKALLHVARVMSETAELTREWGVEFSAPAINLERLRQRKEQIIGNMAKGLGQLAKRRKVTVIQARGAFENSSTLHLEGSDPQIPADGRLTYDHLILATGSTPSMPSAFALASPRVVDSSGALALTEIPKTMLVIGGGYIGLEMGSVYAALGTEVSVVELTEGLLPGADRDLVKPLQRRLNKLFGERIFLNSRVGSLTDVGNAVKVTFEGPSKFGVESYERVLVAVGRRPNSRGFGLLENTKVQVDERGFAIVDAQRRTHDPHILAIGDVAGEPMLAHKASHEARLAVETLCGEAAQWDKQAIPAVVFTDPEIAWAGLTADQAAREQRAVEVAMYPWAASGRAQALGCTDGLTKWIIDPETRQVLGCGIVGAGAGELIAEAVLAIEMGCDARDITESVHPHPTLSETLMNAGEVFFGTAVEIYKPKRS